MPRYCCPSGYEGAGRRLKIAENVAIIGLIDLLGYIDDDSHNVKCPRDCTSYVPEKTII